MSREGGSKRPPTLGKVALGITVGAVVAGGAMLFVAGYMYGPAAAAVAQLPADATIDDLPASALASVQQATIWFNIGFSAYVLLALWGAILGVTAFIRRQGRRWAAWAMASALLGGIAVLMIGALGLSISAG